MDNAPQRPKTWRVITSSFERSCTSGERTGWRDEEISRRHRRWGLACAATDIDFLLVEHYFGVPVAIVEYKRLGVAEYFKSPNYWALEWLADRGEIYFVIAVYDPEAWGVRVFPMNAKARSAFNWGEELSEREWVRWLHRIRGAVFDERTRDLGDERPGAAGERSATDTA